jgi:hypothetical protein
MNMFHRIIQILTIGLMIKIKRLTTTIPPLSGPCSQGLNIPSKKVKVVTSEKNNNGGYRQVTSKYNRK